uniref:hypothetical protein n=1 Tax=Enterocloster clostridioformis TaxID=1531 RepID=UPI0026EBCC93|nr:hypothetical protein [Enterocloster clostridioformis]
MELTARYGLEFNPFLKNSKEILFEGAGIQKQSFVWITLPGPKASAFLPVLRAGERQLWSVPGLPD